MQRKRDEQRTSPDLNYVLGSIDWFPVHVGRMRVYNAEGLDHIESYFEVRIVPMVIGRRQTVCKCLSNGMGWAPKLWMAATAFSKHRRTTIREWSDGSALMLKEGMKG